MVFRKKVMRKGKKPYRKFKGKPKIEKNFRALNGYGVKPEPFPKRLFTRVKAGINVALTTAAITANSAEHVFRLTSPWDPDYTTGAGSYTAQGWPELQGLYNRYIVLGAKYIVSFSNPTSDGLRVFISLNQTGTTGGHTFDNLLNNPLTYFYALNNTGSQRKTFKGYVKPWSLTADCMSKSAYKIDSNQLYSSTTGSNPASTTVLRVGVVGDSSTAASQSVHVGVKIIYYVQLYDRKATTRSQFA